MENKCKTNNQKIETSGNWNNSKNHDNNKTKTTTTQSIENKNNKIKTKTKIATTTILKAGRKRTSYLFCCCCLCCCSYWVVCRVWLFCVSCWLDPMWAGDKTQISIHAKKTEESQKNISSKCIHFICNNNFFIYCAKKASKVSKINSKSYVVLTLALPWLFVVYCLSNFKFCVS